MLLTLAFLLGLLTGIAAGVTGGTLLATHILNQPRRAWPDGQVPPKTIAEYDQAHAKIAAILEQ